MRLDVRMILTTLLMAGCLGLAGCGGEQKSSNAVQMKDLEVVDGTTTDAMTDLDGVQSEAPAMAVPGVKADNATAPATKDETAGNAAAPADTEVLSDQ